jgi:hypothetical protein
MPRFRILSSFNLDKIRNRGITQDTVKGLNEGNRDEPPLEFRDRVYSFRSRLGRTTKASPRPRPASPPPSGGK